MVQRIQKLVVTPNPGTPTKSDITIYIQGTDGDPGGVYEAVGVTTAEFLASPALGDTLVVDFPEIDLPTT